MAYTLTLEARRRYYATEKEKKGCDQLNREAVIRYVNRLKRMTVNACEKYELTSKDCPWLADSHLGTFAGRKCYMPNA